MAQKRKGAEAFSTGFGSQPEQTTGFSMDPTRVDGVQAGFEETDDQGEPLFHAIVTDVFRIGREAECNMVIKADTKVSRRHATVIRRGMAYVIQDNGSSNGTYVNSERISAPHELMIGDKIRIGARELTFARRVRG